MATLPLDTRDLGFLTEHILLDSEDPGSREGWEILPSPYLTHECVALVIKVRSGQAMSRSGQTFDRASVAPRLHVPFRTGLESTLATAKVDRPQH